MFKHHLGDFTGQWMDIECDQADHRGVRKYFKPLSKRGLLARYARLAVPGQPQDRNAPATLATPLHLFQSTGLTALPYPLLLLASRGQFDLSESAKLLYL